MLNVLYIFIGLLSARFRSSSQSLSLSLPALSFIFFALCFLDLFSDVTNICRSVQVKGACLQYLSIICCGCKSSWIPFNVSIFILTLSLMSLIILLLFCSTIACANGVICNHLIYMFMGIQKVLKLCSENHSRCKFHIVGSCRRCVSHKSCSPCLDLLDIKCKCEMKELGNANSEKDKKGEK